MRISKLVSQLGGVLILALSASAAMAGPVIIAGTDSDDHGYFDGSENKDGWAFMQKAFENVGGAVTNGNKSVVCIGCNGSQASSAFGSATSLSALNATWTFHSLSSDTDIANFFNGTGMLNINNAGMIYMPTVESNVFGGISDSQLGIVNANGNLLNSFVAGGGGLYTQEQANSGIGYGWLSMIYPGLGVFGDNAGGVSDSSVLKFTADGSAAFPGLSDTDISNATPWHAYFTNFGSLKVLAQGDGDGVGGYNDAVIIGGNLQGGLTCGMPGQPSCDVPEPDTLPLLAIGMVGYLAWRRKRA